MYLYRIIERTRLDGPVEVIRDENVADFVDESRAIQYTEACKDDFDGELVIQCIEEVINTLAGTKFYRGADLAEIRGNVIADPADVD